MASAVGSLKVLLSADIGKFTSDMGRAAGVSDRQMKSIQRTAERAFKAVAMAAAAAGASLAALTAVQMRQVDALAKQSDALGISTEALAALDLQAKLSGTSLDAVTTAQARLQRSISDASDGLATQTRAFAALGIEVEALKRQSPEQQWRTVADAISRMENPTQRNAAAMQLLGRSATNLMPMLLQGAAGFDEATAATERFGTAIDRASARQIEQANDSLTRMAEGARGLGRAIAVQASPFIEAMGNALSNLGGDSDDMTNKVLFGFDIVIRAAGMVGNSIRGLQLIWRSLKVVAIAAVEGIVGILELLERATIGVINTFRRATGKDLLDASQGMFSQIRQSISQTRRNLAGEVHDLLMEGLPSDLLDGWVNRTRDASRAAAKAYADNIPPPGAWDPVVEESESAVERIRAASERGLTAVSTFADQAARNVQTAFADFLFDPFDKGLKGMLKGFIDVVRRMIAEAAALKILGGDGMGKFFSAILTGLGLPTIAGTRANGGPVAGGSTYLVGEKGPELFMPNTSGTIIPNGGGGGVVVNVTVPANVDPRQFVELAREIGRNVMEATETRMNYGYWPA